MNSRMDKYEFETPEYKKRTDRNAELYTSSGVDNYDKFDINSNISVLKTDARKIDVDQIRDMLDKKYRDNIPKRKSISLDQENFSEQNDLKEDTKEYDINSILNKARINKNFDYEKERLQKVNNDEISIIDEINKKYSKKEDTAEEKELLNLINTITELELKNKNTKDDADLLDLNDDEVTVCKEEPEIPKTKEEQAKEFYTGRLAVTEDDFDDFKDMQDDIKSNSILIKILIFIFVLIAIAIIVVVINKVMNLGLF